MEDAVYEDPKIQDGREIVPLERMSDGEVTVNGEAGDVK
jgi:hypothetical protein